MQMIFEDISIGTKENNNITPQRCAEYIVFISDVILNAYVETSSLPGIGLPCRLFQFSYHAFSV